MRVCVIGTGYVGLVTGVCLAQIGHHVICVDNNAEKVALIQSGQSPIFEPGLAQIMQTQYIGIGRPTYKDITSTPSVGAELVISY